MFRSIDERQLHEIEEEVKEELNEARLKMEQELESLEQLIEYFWTFHYDKYRFPLQILPVMLDFVDQLKDSSSEQEEAILTAYQSRLDEMATLCADTYREYLEMKDQITMRGERLTRTPELVSNLIGKYQVHINKQRKIYEIDRDALKNNFDHYRSTLQSGFETLENESTARDEKKTEQTSRAGRIKEDYRKLYEKTIRAKIIARNQENFLALCEFNQLGTVKTYLSKFDNETVIKDFLNQEWPMRQDCIEGCATRALHVACYNGHVEIVRYLLDQGADPRLLDGDGYTALHLLLRRGDCFHWESIVSAILEKYPEALQAQGPYNRTLLHTAVHFNNGDAVNYLLRHGANINATETTIDCYGRTPLHVAVFQGHIYMVRLLLGYNPNIFFVNAVGETPLVEAMVLGRVEIAEILIKFFNDRVGQQSAKIAELSHNSEISIALINPVINSFRTAAQTLQQLVPEISQNQKISSTHMHALTKNWVFAQSINSATSTSTSSELDVEVKRERRKTI